MLINGLDQLETINYALDKISKRDAFELILNFRGYIPKPMRPDSTVVEPLQPSFPHLTKSPDL